MFFGILLIYIFVRVITCFYILVGGVYVFKFINLVFVVRYTVIF